MWQNVTWIQTNMFSTDAQATPHYLPLRVSLLRPFVMGRRLRKRMRRRSEHCWRKVTTWVNFIDFHDLGGRHEKTMTASTTKWFPFQVTVSLSSHQLKMIKNRLHAAVAGHASRPASTCGNCYRNICVQDGPTLFLWLMSPLFALNVQAKWKLRSDCTLCRSGYQKLKGCYFSALAFRQK